MRETRRGPWEDRQARAVVPATRATQAREEPRAQQVLRAKRVLAAAMPADQAELRALAEQQGSAALQEAQRVPAERQARPQYDLSEGSTPLTLRDRSSSGPGPRCRRDSTALR